MLFEIKLIYSDTKSKDKESLIVSLKYIIFLSSNFKVFKTNRFIEPIPYLSCLVLPFLTRFKKWKVKVGIKEVINRKDPSVAKSVKCRSPTAKKHLNLFRISLKHKKSDSFMQALSSFLVVKIKFILKIEGFLILGYFCFLFIRNNCILLKEYILKQLNTEK